MKNLDLDKLAQEYTKTCIRPFKRVAERAWNYLLVSGASVWFFSLMPTMRLFQI